MILWTTLYKTRYDINEHIVLKNHANNNNNFTLEYFKQMELELL